MVVELLVAAIVGETTIATGLVAYVERERRKAIELARRSQQELTERADRCADVIEELIKKAKRR